MELAAINKEIERILLSGIHSAGALEKLLGAKGLFNQGYRLISLMPPKDRKESGKALNELKQRAQTLLKSKHPSAPDLVKSSDNFDPTLPGITSHESTGHLHPLTLTADEIIGFFEEMNFTVALGPEIEDEEHNFDRLNIPKNHPAREMHDTIWLDRRKGKLLRTHTSPMQIRVLEKSTPPVKVVVPGRVFRFEAEDATHANTFHNIEGFVVGESVTFSNLKWILTALMKKLFGKQMRVRFRPSYFPFTEPSAEMDLGCKKCLGSGCGVCSFTGWVEILGAGMIHPKVLANVGIDPAVYTGFAFGIGLERVAMLKYSLHDIRSFLRSEVELIRQFPGF